MIRAVTFTNYLGDSIRLDLARPEESGFIIKSVTGLGPGKANINTTEIATNDGSLFNSSRMPSRNIVISLAYMWKDSIEDVRQLSYKYFPIKKKLTMLIETDNRQAEIEGYVESNDPAIFSKDEGSDISIVCPNPFFYSAGKDGINTTIFYGVEALFEFPFSNESLQDPLLEMGEIKNETEQVVVYNGDAEIGVTITIHAIGEASNITIYNTGTREVMRIDTDKLEKFTGSGIIAGDEIIICTVKGNKSITLLRNGKTTNILNCLDKNADWFQLAKGDNIFAYTAEYGSTNLQFKIENRIVYEGGISTMDVTILNTDLDAVSIVDTYESFIWTDRYYAYGDFELYEAMRDGLLDYIKQDYYLQSKESEHVMIVEKIQITSDTEDGNHVTVTGRSLESILDRRIVWGQKLLSGNLQNGIKTLLNENVISPSDSNRRIPNFIFKESTDPAITKLKLEAQYTGDNLYDVIQKICEEQGIGFKITLNDEKQFVFELYAGSDRSYDQTENPYVIFSPKFENIINSNYIESKASLKTVTLVGGEGEGADRRYTTVGGGSGLNRRELFTDARDISSNVGSDDELTDAEYMAQLQQRGKEKLAENVSITSFEGETETTIMFQYGKDFFNGDIVQIANEYGHETKARILEIVRSEDKDGYSVYPTFKTIEQEGA